MKVFGLNFGGNVKKTDASAASSGALGSGAAQTGSAGSDSGVRAGTASKSRSGISNLFRSAKSRGSNNAATPSVAQSQSNTQMTQANAQPSAHFKKLLSQSAGEQKLQAANKAQLASLTERSKSLNTMGSSDFPTVSTHKLSSDKNIASAAAAKPGLAMQSTATKTNTGTRSSLPSFDSLPSSIQTKEVKALYNARSNHMQLAQQATKNSREYASKGQKQFSATFAKNARTQLDTVKSVEAQISTLLTSLGYRPS